MRPRLKQFIIPCRRRRMSTLPLLLECSTISRLCKSITPPPLSLSHPFHHRSNPSPPLFRTISPLLPSTWQNNIAREAGGRGKETDTPPLRIMRRAHRLPLPPAPFLFVSSSSSPLFGAVPCSESRQKKCLVWPRLSTGDRKGQRLRKGGRCTHHRPTQEPDCRRTTGDSCVKRDRHANNVGCVPTTRRRSREGSAGNDRRLEIASSSSFDVVSPETENAI